MIVTAVGKINASQCGRHSWSTWLKVVGMGAVLPLGLFRIDYSYFFGNKPKGSTAPIPTTFHHVLQLCRPHWDAFILPTAVTIIRTWLQMREEILFYAYGLLIGLELDSTVWDRMCNWTSQLSEEDFAIRMNKDGICKGRLLKSVQHARHTSLKQVFTRLFWD
jgi:hypothetical protein